MNDLNKKMESLGLVDIQKVVPSILTDIRYATVNNFTGKVLYNTPFGLYAVEALANAVLEMSAWLADNLPGFRIVIFDAGRPLSVQKEMFEIVRDTCFQSYIADPYGPTPGGFHNYGLALDFTLADSNGKLLDMGTEYDSFCIASHPGKERELFEKEIISLEAYSNRHLLYSVAGRADLLPHPQEWWHFQLSYDEGSKENFPLLDF